jgi:hypothetical protein
MCDSTGDGTHSTEVVNDDYVFAEYDDGDFSISQSIEIQSGSNIILTISLSPEEGPPSPSHDLLTTEECDDPAGLVLDKNRAASMDPDNDIDLEYWLVDGSLENHGAVIPGGSHEVVLVAIDTRGAAVATDAKTIFVDSGAACK